MGYKGNRNADRRAQNTRYILALEDLGYTVERITAFQYRVCGQLDIYPTSRKFHDLKRRETGVIECSIERFVTERIEW